MSAATANAVLTHGQRATNEQSRTAYGSRVAIVAVAVSIQRLAVAIQETQSAASKLHATTIGHL
jgi:hypothetical protein